MNKIFLIGFMGSGKSLVAKVLRKSLGLEYFDTDKEIMAKMNMNISEIFKEYGEDKFRELEKTMLKEACDNEYVQVVSCGGGICLDQSNVDLMKKNGKIVWLYCTPDKILKRVQRNDNRPMLSGKKDIETITKMFNERMPVYENACDIKIEEGVKSIYDTCKEIVDKAYV